MAAKNHTSKRRRISVSASPSALASLGSSSSLLPGLIDDVALICLARVPRLDYPSLCCVNKKYNKLINCGDLLALRKKLGIVEYLLFMVCYPKGWVMFSPMQNKWLVLPNIPNHECLENRVQASLAVDGELLVFNEEVLKFKIWKFSLRSGYWVKCKDMHCPRRLFASGSLGGIAIVAGGIDTNWNELESAELYDSSTGRWEMLPKMHTPRSECLGFFMEGKFYVIGGISNFHVSLTCGEEFDMETRTWRKIEGMYPNVNRAPPYLAVVNNELYKNEYLSYVVTKYDKANNKWEVTGRLPPMVDESNVSGIEFKACGDQLLVFCKKPNGNGGDIVVNSCYPKSGVKDGNFDWKVIGSKENVRFCLYSYTNTVMGC